jgi:uncharacterized membrane protein YoaT (DUF817 family)|tara:strand:- start:311 stop:562 length:252 start_codon:yes stop_codon:yes gene_type:complete
MEEKEMLDFITIFNLMKQAPEFSMLFVAFFIYLALENRKKFFKLRDYENKDTMGTFVKNEINASEARIKEYIDQKFKALKNGL